MIQNQADFFLKFRLRNAGMKYISQTWRSSLRCTYTTHPASTLTKPTMPTSYISIFKQTKCSPSDMSRALINVIAFRHLSTTPSWKTWIKTREKKCLIAHDQASDPTQWPSTSVSRRTTNTHWHSALTGLSARLYITQLPIASPADSREAKGNGGLQKSHASMGSMLTQQMQIRNMQQGRGDHRRNLSNPANLTRILHSTFWSTPPQNIYTDCLLSCIVV